MERNTKRTQHFAPFALKVEQSLQIKGGDDKRDPRPSGKRGVPTKGNLPNGPNQVIAFAFSGVE